MTRMMNLQHHLMKLKEMIKYDHQSSDIASKLDGRDTLVSGNLCVVRVAQKHLMITIKITRMIMMIMNMMMVMNMLMMMYYGSCRNIRIMILVRKIPSLKFLCQS